ncbi:hypothetical protein DIPPA_58867 [Diplonema papillatum]|nr:hypothetical protein DIPPA_58867 [Diplonema papillatum]
MSIFRSNSCPAISSDVLEYDFEIAECMSLPGDLCDTNDCCSESEYHITEHSEIEIEVSEDGTTQSEVAPVIDEAAALMAELEALKKRNMELDTSIGRLTPAQQVAPTFYKSARPVSADVLPATKVATLDADHDRHFNRSGSSYLTPVTPNSQLRFPTHQRASISSFSSYVSLPLASSISGSSCGVTPEPSFGNDAASSADGSAQWWNAIAKWESMNMSFTQC